MQTDRAFVIALIIMAAGALATRLAGAALMRQVALTRRTESVLEGLSVSVIASLVASGLANAELQIILAVAAAMTVVLLMRNVIWAMAAGTAVAALATATGLT